MPIGLGIGLSISLRGGLGGGFSLTAPVLAFASATDPDSDNTQDLYADFTDLQISDVGRLQISTDVGFTSPTDLTNTADSGEAGALELAFTTGALSDGAYWFRVRHERGATVSSWSNVVTKTITTITLRQFLNGNGTYINSAGLRQFVSGDGVYICEAA